MEGLLELRTLIVQSVLDPALFPMLSDVIPKPWISLLQNVQKMQQAPVRHISFGLDVNFNHCFVSLSQMFSRGQSFPLLPRDAVLLAKSPKILWYFFLFLLKMLFFV